MPLIDEFTGTAVDGSGVATRLPVGSKLGRYGIDDVIGAGGMGVVYRARDPELKRDVAIKVVRLRDRDPTRLLAEARAMAKLSHPSVMPIFDVGLVDDSLYVVMPHIAAGTLHEWIHAEPRQWRLVVDRFVKAGRGLAAAHAAGLVHRDFKPRNVLLDGDDVLVADFGLVAREASPTAESTSTSTLGGTPGYMAPEQAQGEEVDARADQFSFCISLWEGLHGERPQEAETRSQGALPSGSIPPVPSERPAAPAWLLAAVARGFSSRRDDRWPSLDALLDHLERRIRRPRRIAIIAGVVAAAGLAAAGASLVSAEHAPACPDPQARLAHVWSPQIRSTIEAAFRGTNLPYAEDTLTRVLPALDHYANGWRSKQIEACRASRIERTQSETVFDRRSGCLDRRLAALRGRTEAFQSPDASVVERALSSVEKLPALEDCDDANALLAYSTPIAPTLRSRLAALEQELDNVEVMENRQLTKERVAAMPVLIEEARALSHPPVLARALSIQATALRDSNLSREATLRELVHVAAEAHDDLRVVEAWIEIHADLTSRQAKLAEAKALEPVMIAAFGRAGSPPGIVYRLETALAVRALESGEYDDARNHIDKALAAATTLAGRAQARSIIGGIFENMGRYNEGLPYAEQALRETEEARGSFHPRVAERLQQVALYLAFTGDHDREQELLERALEIQERAFGPDDEKVASTLLSLGNLARAKGKVADAERLLMRSVTILEKTDNRRGYAMAETSLADAIYHARGLADAKPHYERSMAEIEKTTGKDNLNYVMTEGNYGSRLATSGDCASARPYFQHAFEYLQRVGHAGVAMATAQMAQCDLKEGKIDEAIAAYERSIEGCRANGCSPGAAEAMKFQLADALVVTRRDRARGIALMREARAAYERLGSAKHVANVDEWMKKHGVRVK